jgi:hypothetical protein
MDMIRKSGFKYMADDKIIIKDDTAYAFPLNVHRFAFMLHNMESENYKNIFEKLLLIYYLLKNYSPSIPIEKKSTIFKLFMITKTSSDSITISEATDKNKIIQKLLENNRLELSLHGSHLPSLTKIRTNPFYRYMLEYTYVFPKNQISRYWDKLYRESHEIFKNIYTFEIYSSERNINNIIDKLI